MTANECAIGSRSLYSTENELQSRTQEVGNGLEVRIHFRRGVRAIDFGFAYFDRRLLHSRRHRGIVLGLGFSLAFDGRTTGLGRFDGDRGIDRFAFRAAERRVGGRFVAEFCEVDSELGGSGCAHACVGFPVSGCLYVGRTSIPHNELLVRACLLRIRDEMTNLGPPPGDDSRDLEI